MQISPSLNAKRSLVLLAPPETDLNSSFNRVSISSSAHDSLKKKMQTLRGRLYVQDGAINQSELAVDGRHVLATDDKSWHLLTIDNAGEVLGCTRYMQHAPGTRFEELGVSRTPLAASDAWGPHLRSAVEKDLSEARRARFSYVEVGGWAMAEQVRCTAECLRSVLATYAWSHLVGGAIGVSTATERNGSASILRRLGGQLLSVGGTEIPAYFDAHYGCRMQMLRYDSREPNARYRSTIDELRETLTNVPVICTERPLWQIRFPRLFRSCGKCGPKAAQSAAMMRQVA